MRLCAFEVLVLWLELVVEVDGPPPPIIASILSLVGTWLAGTLRTIGCVAYYLLAEEDFSRKEANENKAR